MRLDCGWAVAAATHWLNGTEAVGTDKLNVGSWWLLCSYA